MSSEKVSSSKIILKEILLGDLTDRHLTNDHCRHNQIDEQRQCSNFITATKLLINIKQIIGTIPFFLFVFVAIISSGVAEDANEYRETVSTIVPEFISTGGDIAAKENSEIHLECEIKDLGEHAFMWKFNTKFLFVGNLSIQHLTGVRKDSNSNGIFINSLTNNLTGIYTCEISSNPPKSIQYNVSITTAPVIVANPSSGNVVIAKDKPLKLQCNVKPSPLPTTLKWIHNLKVIENNMSNFEIESIQPSDSGRITCDATNEIGTRSFTFNVTVESAPMITVSDKVVHGAIGNDVQIRCSANAYPPAKIEWFFGNNSQIRNSEKHKIIVSDSSSTLHIHNVDPKDHDNYYCQATNPLGSENAYFEVTGRPSKPKFTSPQVSNSGETYSLEWVVFSQTPILSYELRIREINHDNHPNEWRHIQVKPTESEGPLRKQTHILDNLSQYKSYEVDVEVGNEFGKTRSDSFVFTTSDYNGASLNFCSILLMLISSVIASAFHLPALNH